MPKLTFLELVQRLALDVGETAPSLSTLVGVTGRTLRCKNAISWAWIDIQNQHKDWRFLRNATSFTTVAGQSTYTPTQANVPTDTFGRWVLPSFRVYRTTAGLSAEVRLEVQPDYDVWRDSYLIGALRNTRTQPTVISVTPGDALALGPVPDAGFTVLGDYYRNAQQLSADADYPILPIQHDPLIILFRAMELYSVYLGAPDLFDLGQREYTRRYDDLKSEQLPKIGWA